MLPKIKIDQRILLGVERIIDARHRSLLILDKDGELNGLVRSYLKSC